MKNSNPVRLLLHFFAGVFFLLLQSGSPAATQEPPVLSGIEPADLTYTAGGGNTAITNTLIITDNDTSLIISAIIGITEGYDVAEDILSVTNTDSVSAGWDSITGNLTLSGAGSLLHYQKVLRNVQYKNNNSTAPSTVRRVVSFTISDSAGSSNSVSRGIVIQISGPDPEPPPSPTAAISGIDSICQGETAELQIAFTGTPPFDVVLLRNGSDSTEINNILTTNYILRLDKDGLYTLAGLKDANSGGNVSGTGTVLFRNAPTATLSGNESICRDQQAIIKIALTGTEPWRFSYRLNNGTPVLVNNVSAANTEVQVNSTGNYTLVEVSDKYCKGTVSGSALISSSAPPAVAISGLTSSYSNNSQEWIPINGTPSGGEFSGNGVLFYQDIWYFIPSLAQVGINQVVYKYQASPASCFGYDTALVRIFEFGAEIVFQGERTRFCLSDPPFSVQGISLVNSQGIGSFNISGGIGLVDNGDNTATVTPAVLEIGQYTINYISGDGTSVDRIFETGAALKTDFSWETECFEPGGSIDFTNKSSSTYGFITDGSFNWKITSTHDSVTLSSKDISYHFPEPGNYTVELKAKNSYGCMNTAVKVIPLQPVVALSGQNYFENFEEGSFWHSADTATVAMSSWQLGSPAQHGFPPQGFDGAFSGEKCWYTLVASSQVPPEESWITSPCFNFTGTEKPTLVARIWRSFTDNSDGVNIQYSVNNGKTWMPVGVLNDGVNWFNGYFGTSGNQSQGWTDIIDTGWVEIRHELDFLKEETGVQFRFRYKAFGNAVGNDGIAVDDIRIVERNRTVLFEHFTNAGDAKSALADSLVKGIVQQSGDNIIDIQYHTSEPGDDPFNDDNPLIAGARQFYYGLTDVPYTLINGGTQSSQRIDYGSGTIDRNRVKIESLYDSDFQIQVHTMIQSNTLYTEALVNSMNVVPETELSVRMVVMEPLIVNGSGSYRNVVRAMLPDASGTVIYKSFSRDEVLPVRYSWKIQNVNDPGKLRVAVFIQNEVTHEIYQAALDTRGTVTDLDDEVKDTDQPEFRVYPNPAQGLVFVKSDPGIRGNVKLELFNSTGSLVISDQIFQGEEFHAISLDALPRGIYLLRVSTPERILGNRKIVVSR